MYKMDIIMHENWQSPLSYRYGSEQMRTIWSEKEKRRTWRRVWVALARAQSHFGLVSEEELTDIEGNVDNIDVTAAEALEKLLRHDLVAELNTFVSQCPIGGRILHLGATSMDVEDNADVMRMKLSVKIIVEKLHKLLLTLGQRIEDLADKPTMGFTHLQPAEPTTVGYRLAQWTQDLLEDAKALSYIKHDLRGKGIKGAVGTSASYLELLGSEHEVETFERLVLQELGLECFPVTTQTYTRKQDLNLVNVLAGLGQSLYKIAYDIRLLQSPVIGELKEPFGERQVGSSAMPFKQNPVSSENIDSLARQLAALPRIAWDNAAHSHLERTLDDSANRRSLIPEAFLLTDTILMRMQQVVEGLVHNVNASRKLLSTYGPFSATEKVLIEAVKNGAGRHELHEKLRQISLEAWQEVEAGGDNRLLLRLEQDADITRFVPKNKLASLLDASNHVGCAASKAKQFALHMKNTVSLLEI